MYIFAKQNKETKYTLFGTLPQKKYYDALGVSSQPHRFCGCDFGCVLDFSKKEVVGNY